VLEYKARAATRCALYVQLAEEIRNRRPSSVEDQPDIYDDQGLALRDAVKRGRWQGFCFRRTRSGRILPYICWKGCASICWNLLIYQ